MNILFHLPAFFTAGKETLACLYFKKVGGISPAISGIAEKVGLAVIVPPPQEHIKEVLPRRNGVPAGTGNAAEGDAEVVESKGGRERKQVGGSE